MRYGIVIAVSAWAAFSVPACHFFEDSDNVDECGLNSGYPCPCVPEDADFECKNGSGDYCCKDGRSSCVWFGDNNETRGICSMPCLGIADSQSCINTKDFGSEGVCAMMVNDATSPNYCEVVCDPESDECPPGMECLSGFYLNFSVCRPEQPE